MRDMRRTYSLLIDLDFPQVFTLTTAGDDHLHASSPIVLGVVINTDARQLWTP